MKPTPGLLVWADLAERQPPGFEQEGRRPCVVVAVPAAVYRPRFPVVILAPMTTTAIPAAILYPRLAAGAGGLRASGTVLIDQVQAVDVRRLNKQIGQLAPVEYQPIADGLRVLFGLLTAAASRGEGRPSSPRLMRRSHVFRE